MGRPEGSGSNPSYVIARLSSVNGKGKIIIGLQSYCEDGEKPRSVLGQLSASCELEGQHRGGGGGGVR